MPQRDTLEELRGVSSSQESALLGNLFILRYSFGNRDKLYK
jgi:hypothetical protein